MPEIIIVNDNASFTTSSSSSFTFRHTTTHPPTTITATHNANTHSHPTLRRKPTTVQRLSTWVTKRISKPRLRTGNGNDFLYPPEDQAQDYEPLFENGGETVGAAGAVRDTGRNEYAYEHHDHDHEEKLYESYAAFCDAFTSSGIGMESEMIRRSKRKKDMVIQAYIQPTSTSAPSRPASTVISTSPALTATATATATTTTMTYSPNETTSVSCEMAQEISPVDSGCYSSSSFSFERCKEKELSLETEDDYKPDSGTNCHSHSNCPAPPPEVLTPALYAQMSRDSRQARKSKRWWWFRGSTVRLWFSCGRNGKDS